MTKVRVGIALGSASAIEVVRRALGENSEFEVAWTVRSSDEFRRRDADLPVAMLLLSVDLPGDRASNVVRGFLAKRSAAVLLVRESPSTGAAEVYAAMDAGALDVVALPTVDAEGRLSGLDELRRKLSVVGRLGRRSGSEPNLRATAVRELPSPSPPGSGPAATADAVLQRDELPPLVVIGASTGGPAAIARVLSGLSRPVEAAIVVVQHVDGPFASTVASWLAHGASFEVVLAEAGSRPRPGIALLAATSHHLVMGLDGTLDYVEEPVSNPYRPSVDVFFESVAKHYRGPVVGVLLTGMGRDGAKGLLALRRRGFETIAQDEATSVVFGMPRAAIELGAAVEIRSLDRIAPAIERALLAVSRTS